MNTKKSIFIFFKYSSVILLLVLLAATFYNKLGIMASEEKAINYKESTIILLDDGKEDFKKSNYMQMDEDEVLNESVDEVQISNMGFRVDKHRHVIICYCFGFYPTIQREDRFFTNIES